MTIRQTQSSLEKIKIMYRLFARAISHQFSIRNGLMRMMGKLTKRDLCRPLQTPVLRENSGRFPQELAGPMLKNAPSTKASCNAP